MSSQADVDQLLKEAEAELRRRNYQRAAELFGQVLEQDPDSVDAHRGAGLASFLCGRFEDAVHHFQRWMQIRPLDAHPYINMGAAYMKMGQFQKAAEVLQRAVQRDAKSFEAYYNLGLAYRKMNQLGMAMNAYKEAIRVNPDSVDAHQNLANVLLKMGNPRKAIEHYEKALELAPDFEKAKRGLEKAQQALQASPQVSPFGRLVDEQTLARNVAGMQFRELTLQERLQDRQELRDIAQELVEASTEWLEHLRDRLAPALHELHRATVEENEALLLETYATYRSALEKHEELSRRVREAVQRLKEHEDQMKVTPSSGGTG